MIRSMGFKESLGQLLDWIGAKVDARGTSLVVQWLRIRLPMQGMWVRSLVGELGSHMLQSN